MLRFYRTLTAHSDVLIKMALQKRADKGKEDRERLTERWGQPGRPRPDGSLLWVHAASVGETQSALIVITKIRDLAPTLPILITTGTRTSCDLVSKRLTDENIIHQYLPFDHPRWVKDFLEYWNPHMVFWMESELWPNMLLALKERHVPTFLINARLSDRSYRRWKIFKRSVQSLLRCFSGIFTQTEQDTEKFSTLGASNLHTLGNLKYSAAPLPYNDQNLEDIQITTQNRTIWLYASTHDGEEALACKTHKKLKENIPGLLTIIVPRHPERREDILQTCQDHGCSAALRGNDLSLPGKNTDIYIADTLGELGLFYRLAPLACIGRSFSKDGGGGHNPIEALQQECCVLYGPNVQYQQQLYDDLYKANAAISLNTEDDLATQLLSLLQNPETAAAYHNKGQAFLADKTKIIDTLMEHLTPVLDRILQEQESNPTNSTHTNGPYRYAS